MNDIARGADSTARAPEFHSDPQIDTAAVGRVEAYPAAPVEVAELPRGYRAGGGDRRNLPGSCHLVHPPAEVHEVGVDRRSGATTALTGQPAGPADRDPPLGARYPLQGRAAGVTEARAVGAVDVVDAQLPGGDA